jgi:hypothetical protein
VKEAMNQRDRHREEQLDRLFQAGASIPTLEPDPGLPGRIRQLASVRTPAREAVGAGWMRPRWAWLSMAGAAFALSLFAGGYIGYRAWTASQDAATTDDVLMTALSQSGLADDLGALDGADDEVQE